MEKVILILLAAISIIAGEACIATKIHNVIKIHSKCMKVLRLKAGEN